MLPLIQKSVVLSDDASVHPQKAIVSLYTESAAKNRSAFAFNILVNNADFYSGTCYNDGGITAWGELNKRGSEFDPGSVWKWVTYNFQEGGADPVLKKLGSLIYRDFTVTPDSNSGSMSIDISDIPNYKDLILWETLFPRMLSDLDMANWNTSMLRTGVGYDWNYDADKGILSISSRHTECVLVQYGTALKQRTVRVYYI